MPDIKKKKSSKIPKSPSKLSEMSNKGKIHKMKKNNYILKNQKKDSIYDFYVKPKFYIFQIGFNRCATQSLHETFLKLGIKSIHFRWVPSKTCSEQKLAVVMYDNLCNPQINHKILDGSLSTYQAFSDMEYTYEDYSFEFYKYFKDIENQNHGSKFIMNIRDCEDWLKSRIKLGSRIELGSRIKIKNKISDVLISDYYKNITNKKLKEWIDLYFRHSVNVRDYFKLPLIANRSKLYVLPIDEKSITELFREMGIYDGNENIDEKVDFLKNKRKRQNLTNEEKAHITDDIKEYIKEKIKIHGDPSKLIWWK